MSTTEAEPADKRAERRIELVSTLLLAVATVATAWSSYQAARWHGEQARAQTTATASRVESTRAEGVANRQAEVDVATFIQWVDAHARGETMLEAFYRERFRDEFKPAFEAWIATEPLTNLEAPPTPFVLPEYELAAIEEAEELEADATSASETARIDIQRADNYVLAVVLFAASLFFAGISTRLTTRGAQAAILGLGCLLFVSTLVWIATFPVSLEV